MVVGIGAWIVLSRSLVFFVGEGLPCDFHCAMFQWVEDDVGKDGESGFV